MGKKNKKGSNKPKAPKEDAPEDNRATNEPVNVSEDVSGGEDVKLDSESEVDQGSKEQSKEPPKEQSKEDASEELEKKQKQIDSLTAELEKLKLQSQPQGDEELKKEVEQLRERAETAEQEKEDVEQQYEDLLEKISHIKSTLGQRLQVDAAELASYKETVQRMEEEDKRAKETIETLQREVITANRDSDKLSHDLSTLRKEYQEAMNNWEKEKNSLVSDQRKVQADADKYRKISRDLEVAILEERAQSENYDGRLSGLEEQVQVQTGYAEQYRQERDEYKSKLEDSQKAFEDQALEFSKKLTELEKTNQDVRDKLQATETSKEELGTKMAELEKEVQRLTPLEAEVKEKSLLVGKLRHEAVILNEHLTKALRMIKKDSEGESVDKQLISNLIISFVTIPRGDTKKFEVLQLISNFLGWDEDQKIQAGLSRGAMSSQGSSRGGLASPKRSMSSTSIADDSASSGGFMGLFAEFLERESSKK